MENSKPYPISMSNCLKFFSVVMHGPRKVVVQDGDERCELAEKKGQKGAARRGARFRELCVDDYQVRVGSLSC